MLDSKEKQRLHELAQKTYLDLQKRRIKKAKKKEKEYNNLKINNIIAANKKNDRLKNR